MNESNACTANAVSLCDSRRTQTLLKFHGLLSVVIMNDEPDASVRIGSAQSF